MKKLLTGILALSMCLSLVPVPARAEAETATVEMPDFNDGTLTLTLTMEDGAIQNVEVTRSTEEVTPGTMAVQLLPPQMVEKNTADVDVVEGATFTSNSIIRAAKAAMAKLGAGDEENLAAWAEANGYVKAEDYRIVTDVDAVSSATATGAPSGLNFGFISFEKEDLADVIAKALAGPYTWGEHEPKNVIHTQKDFVEGVDLTGTPLYRDMVVLGTCYNNIPNTSTVELVYDPYTSMFYGSSEAGTSKIQELAYNPYVTVTWVTQMTDEMFDDMGDGYPAYADYGKLNSVMVYGRLHFLTDEDFDGGEAEEKALRALDVYMPTYYGTRWPFPVIDPKADFAYDNAEERAAKVEAAKKELQGVSAKYYIEPYRITFSLFSTFAPFAISETSAWSTYKTYSIKTEEASAENNFTEKWTGITKDQYCQAAIEKTPGSVNAGLRYWYKSAQTWDFTWSEDGKELLAVEEVKNGEEAVPYVTPYKYKWVRDSFEELTGTLREKWAQSNQETLVAKAGEDVDKTFRRFVLLVDKTLGEGDSRHAGEVVKADEVEANKLVLGEDYKVQEITLPNYTYYALTYKYAMSGVQSQQNYLPYPEVNPVQTTASDSETEVIEDENVITDGTFNYELKDDGTYEIVKYKVTEGQGLIVELPAEYDGKAVTSVGKEAFKDSTCIGKIIVPAGYTTFKEGAFAGVKSLKSMLIPETVTVIEKDCFNRTGWGNMNVDSFCIIEFAAPAAPAQDLMLGEEKVGLDGTQVRIKVTSAAAVEAYKEAWAGYADLISKDWVNPE